MQLYIFSILAVTAQPPRWHELTAAYSYAEYSADFGKEQVRVCVCVCDIYELKILCLHTTTFL